MGRAKKHQRVSSQELADRRDYLHASHRRGDHDKHVSSARKADRKAARKATTEVPIVATPEEPAVATPEVPAVATPEVPVQPAQPTPQPIPEVPARPTQEPSPQQLPEVPDHDTAEPSTSRPERPAVEEPLESESEPEPEFEAEAVVEVDDPRRPPLQRDPPFPGGPDELSLLRHYPDHMAPWTYALLGTTNHRYVDRGDLRLASASVKLGLMTCEGDDYREVRLIVERSGLYPLACWSYAATDPGLISALVERWHEETSSFHIPFREMTVTLDGVSALLHIPVGGRFYTPGLASREDVAETCALLLGGGGRYVPG